MSVTHAIDRAPTAERPLVSVERAVTRVAARAAIIGGSLMSGSLFWVRAALGQNQLHMHKITADGEISIGGVSEQLYGEGFMAAFHDVLARELGDRAPQVLYQIGLQGGRWETRKAIEKGEWVPTVIRRFVGKPALLERARSSRLLHALIHESLLILFRMIVTEGGWGRLVELDMRSNPPKMVVGNTPEWRRLGHTGKCSCHMYAGALSGYFEILFGTPAPVRETTCQCAGDPHCTFEVGMGGRA